MKLLKIVDDFIGCETYVSKLNMLVIESASNLTDDHKRQNLDN